MKGQITLEYMFLSLVVLALLSISLTALVKIKDNSSDAMVMVFFKSSARDLHNAIESVCALGNGNSREVTLKHELRVEYLSGYLEFSGEGIPDSIKYDTMCSVSPDGIYSGTVTVTNREGEIELEKNI